VQDAKAALDAANDKLREATQTVANAHNNVDLATQANDDAITQLKVADAALAAAQHELEDANKAVADLRASYTGVKNDLGVANFNLQQALNNLFVAQAAKAAADKAVELAYAQGVASLDVTNGNSTYVFNGCVEQIYPTISGTVPVGALITSGARLNSGHILTWGDCTQKTAIILEGDVVTFTGTIKDGVISATQITKITA
jgi:multidrug efflux pump subunit AcrA (membrane-fusion protein)